MTKISICLSTTYAICKIHDDVFTDFLPFHPSIDVNVGAHFSFINTATSTNRSIKECQRELGTGQLMTMLPFL